MAYELTNGYMLSDDEIEKRAREWEDETWEGELVELRVGRPRLSNKPNANLSFKCPASAAELIASAAHAEGVKKSEFIRRAVIEKALCVLGSVH